MRDEGLELERTVRSFRREVKSIARRTGRVRSPLGRAVLLAFLAVQALFIALPPFRYPADGRITSGYSIRRKPDIRSPFAFETHRAVDIAAPAGTPIRSAAPGIVSEAGFEEAAGNYVRIIHLFGFSTYYAHFSGTAVKQGDLSLFRLLPIGTAGSTGRSTGPHLHFEIRLLGIPLPPRVFLVYHDIRKLLFGF